LRRISGRAELDETPPPVARAEDIPASLEGPVQRYIMPGTRRLDMDVAEYEYVDTLPPSEPINFRKHLSPPGHLGERRYEEAGSPGSPGTRVGQHHVGEIVSNSLVHSVSLAISGGEESQWSSPLDLTDEYSWSVQPQSAEDYETPGGQDNSVQQDYQDIDYTSGSLVSFHTSLSR